MGTDNQQRRAASLQMGIGRLWQHGWAPADLVHVVGKQLTFDATEEMIEQVLSDGRRRPTGRRATAAGDGRSDVRDR